MVISGTMPTNITAVVKLHKNANEMKTRQKTELNAARECGI